MRLTLVTLALALICALLSPRALAETKLSFSLSDSEGGQLRKRSISRFENYLDQQNCAIKISPATSTLISPSSLINADILFSAELPLTTLELKQQGYQPLNRALIANNQALTMTLMIKKSTGIEDLSSLTGERLGIVSQDSFIGGKIAKQLLADAGVVLKQDDIYETGSYLGAMSMLLHGDVFFAAIPGPLARQWKDYNKLNIIAESSAFELGIIYIKSELPESTKHACQQAFNNLSKKVPSGKAKNKKMIIFPSWVVGFKSY